ncbi:Tripartite motif-containing protein 2 [Holothuria leucospilota]|uniref:Tripartite motif-containing protein 2 n=1 Tax=Holothuria leucospilota TaxID=206669 RepID=A0A9Q1CD07_HOLLE|nr:Tripartite motif-containing protein 2 [Holothuria leucospilota]
MSGAMELKPREISGKCSVCKESYTDPKILPCIHTFCKKCIVDGTRSGNRHFCCPLCKTQHSLTKDKINALPDNFFACSLPNFESRPQSAAAKSGILERETGKLKRPKSSVSRLDLTPIVARKVVCLRHPNGSVYCKTCNVFQCLMCRSNKEHRGHELIEATEVEEFSDDEESESDRLFLSVLQQQHVSGQTEEICQRAMKSVRDEASALMESINERAAEVIKRIEEEKLMLLKNLTLAEAKKLQTIRRALESANKVAKSNQRLCKQPTHAIRDNHLRQRSPIRHHTNGGLGASNDVLELENSLQSLGITFVSYGDVRSVIGELNDVAMETTDNELLDQKDTSSVKLEHRHTVIGGLTSPYNRFIQSEIDDVSLNGHISPDETSQPADHLRCGPPKERKPQPAYRKPPVEHRPLPPIPAPRTCRPGTLPEQNWHEKVTPEQEA